MFIFSSKLYTPIRLFNPTPATAPPSTISFIVDSKSKQKCALERAKKNNRYIPLTIGGDRELSSIFTF